MRDLRIFRAEVLRVEDLAPSMRRVVLGGDGLAGFTTTGVADEYVRILLPAEGTREPALPVTRDGDVDVAAVDMSLLRTYTVRAFDPATGEVTIDFVLHETGIATTWASSAAPGDAVAITSATGLYDPPADLGWQLLVADYAGLPALARILEQTPPQVYNRVVVEVRDAEHEIALPAHPSAEVTWVHGGNNHRASRLEEVVRSVPRPVGGRGYTWVAGETRALRGVRRHLRRELGLPASAYKVVGYWIERAEEWSSRYRELDDATRLRLEQLWQQDRDEEEIEEEYDEQLTALGL